MNLQFRPSFQILDADAIKKIVETAYDLIQEPGFTLHDQEGLQLMAQAGATVHFEAKRVQAKPHLIDHALSTVPSSFALYNQNRGDKLDLGGMNNYYGTSGTAIFVQDFAHEKVRRKPLTRDCVDHNIVLEASEYLSMQAGPIVCSDVPKEIADTYRLLLCMLFTNKPVIATSFSPEGYRYMREMLSVMAGNEADIVQRPSHIFATNVSSPLAWSDIAAYNLIAAAKEGMPVKFTSIPVAGGTAPVTLGGTMAQITAENLSAILIHQCISPGSPMLWGGCPSILEMRYGTTPMTSIESIMMSCANTQIGKYFGLPTASHGGRANAKRVDAQSGFETAIPITLHALVGTNQIGGAGFLEYASTQSLEKLVLDNEICGEAIRLVRGLEVAEENLACDLIKEISQTEDGFMSTPHTRKWFKKELHFPSEVIDVATRSHYESAGSKDARERAHDKVLKILSSHEPLPIEEKKRQELIKIVTHHAKHYNLDRLPIAHITSDCRAY
jgi:trimethylamine--corrinoid protein Co-methyltransferase